MRLSGKKLIDRYKKNYSIPAEAKISEEMILKHWELEKRLTKQLLESTPENRWKVFEHCYTKLYSELDWLNDFTEKNKKILSPAKRYKNWIETIGTPPQRIYEIGSGKGELINFLAKHGFECKATEITKERGEKYSGDVENLSWGISDGIHLDFFEKKESYDVVISNQVIEHLHPMDLTSHLKGVYNILKRNGRYILNTPHSYTGPHDISLVFKCSKPFGMHLKEYTYRELVKALRNAGFSRIYRVIPSKLQRILYRIGIKKANLVKWGILYLDFMLVIEAMLSLIFPRKLRRFCSLGLKKTFIFMDSIFLVGEKS